MNYEWTVFIHLGILSIALIASSYIRSKVSFFQKYLIPNALTAGFILLLFYNFIAPNFALSTDLLGELVYHLLNISFIAMTLRKSPKADNAMKKRIFPTSIGVLSQYAVQCAVGLLVTMLLIKTVMPDLFPAIGFSLPLGFVLGPGQAFTIGSAWETFGFRGAGSTGLTFAAIGFLWGCFGGVLLINMGLKRKWISPEEVDKIRNKDTRSGILGKKAVRPISGYMSTETEAIDSMTFNAAFVFGVYLLAFGLLKLITLLLSFIGPLGNELAVNLWGINFIFSAITAMLVKGIMRKLHVHYVLDSGTLTRLSGLSVDVMVTASIAAISLVVVGMYWLPILILTTAGGLMAYFTLPWICSRLFVDHQFHRALIIFGASTGTMPTGLALLRVIDPEFETPVASDYMYSSGFTFLLAIPLILSINLPAYSVTKNNPDLFWLAVLISFVYLIFVVAAFFIISRKRGIAQPGRRWYREGDPKLK
ncbi:MAG: sodium:glutamate symporter [Spirochaetales bacterium]|jgi:ESS family glutamate:Na+ symporter|nr:sodium:glutamate symporter [Spirochaetales bacterium]